MSNVGKTIWNHNHTERGVVVNESTRYCAVLGRTALCLVVRWADGSQSKESIRNVKCLSNGNLEIM